MIEYQMNKTCARLVLGSLLFFVALAVLVVPMLSTPFFLVAVACMGIIKIDTSFLILYFYPKNTYWSNDPFFYSESIWFRKDIFFWE